MVHTASTRDMLGSNGLGTSLLGDRGDAALVSCAGISGALSGVAAGGNALSTSAAMPALQPTASVRLLMPTLPCCVSCALTVSPRL